MARTTKRKAVVSRKYVGTGTITRAKHKWRIEPKTPPEIKPHLQKFARGFCNALRTVRSPNEVVRSQNRGGIIKITKKDGVLHFKCKKPKKLQMFLNRLDKFHPSAHNPIHLLPSREFNKFCEVDEEYLNKQAKRLSRKINRHEAKGKSIPDESLRGAILNIINKKPWGVPEKKLLEKQELPPGTMEFLSS